MKHTLVSSDLPSVFLTDKGEKEIEWESLYAMFRLQSMTDRSEHVGKW